MDEEFVLVSKKKIKEYEDTIKSLEKQVEIASKSPSTPIDTSTIEQVITSNHKDIHEQLEKFKSEIFKKIKSLENLSEITIEKKSNPSKNESKNSFDYTKNFDELHSSVSTLTSKTLSIEKEIRSTNSEIIDNLKLLVEHLQDSDNIEKLLMMVTDIKELINANVSNPQKISNCKYNTFEETSSTSLSQANNSYFEQNSSSHLEIIEKLQEIELFMTNLRVLLSYVRPKYIEREK